MQRPGAINSGVICDGVYCCALICTCRCSHCRSSESRHPLLFCSLEDFLSCVQLSKVITDFAVSRLRSWPNFFKDLGHEVRERSGCLIPLPVKPKFSQAGFFKCWHPKSKLLLKNVVAWCFSETPSLHCYKFIHFSDFPGLSEKTIGAYAHSVSANGSKRFPSYKKNACSDFKNQANKAKHWIVFAVEGIYRHVCELST